MHFFVWMLLSLGLLIGCTSQPSTATSEDELPTIVAIGRYVLATNRFWDLYDHVESLERGGIAYDSEFRHPYLPLGGLVVDCQQTHRIGVTLAVGNSSGTKRIGAFDRYGGSWSKELKVRYRWKHSEAKEIGRSYYVTPSPYGRSDILSDGITLTKERRVDGVWKVEVAYNEDTIYQADFQLVGCPSSTQ